MMIFGRLLLSIISVVAMYVFGFIVLFGASLLGAGTFLALLIIAAVAALWLLMILRIWKIWKPKTQA